MRKTIKRGKSWTLAARPVNGPESQTEWNTVDWRKATRTVRRLRQRIFAASQREDLKTVRSLQKLMLRSRANILMSVRRVTQVNDGKKTPGVDKLLVKTPAARGLMVDRLSAATLWKALPARRVYIPKSNGKQRPLGIPVMDDRARQAMVKNALEPYWEAKFEATSYGFRPGRSQHDAIEKIYGFARPNMGKKWVLDADIKGAFDNIGHDHLMEVIGEFPGREMIRQWLKAGYVEEEIWKPTEAGTPQGGVISPLLANIALHGMEQAIGIRYQSPNSNRYSVVCAKRAVVRYADDFVVFCETQEDAEQTKTTLNGWLAERGLQISEDKTRIVHMTDGFDFLGFNIRTYKTKSTKTGYKLLIKPSAGKMKETRKVLRHEWQALTGHAVLAVLNKLNPIIRGVGQYFRTGTSKRTFHQMDRFMFIRAARWTTRTHRNKNKAWRTAKYWGRLKPGSDDKWVFGDKATGRHLTKFSWIPIRRHILVKGRNSPDDPALQDYWKERKLSRCRERGISDRKIIVRQKGICPVCGDSLFNGEATDLFSGRGEELHRHHRRPKSKGGSNAPTNLTFLHLYCHQQVHSKGAAVKTNDISHEDMVTEERDRLRRMLALPEDYDLGTTND